MGTVVIYIATSLDGYIAGKKDDLSWLEPFNTSGEDYGYGEFIKTVGSVLMGGRTYEQSLKHPERMLYGLKNYVLSQEPMEVPSGMDVEFYTGDVIPLIEKIKKTNRKNVFVVGGGQVVCALLNAGLVDELFLFIAPVLIKEGIPLYPSLDKRIDLRLVEAVPYSTGMVKLHYQ